MPLKGVFEAENEGWGIFLTCGECLKEKRSEIEAKHKAYENGQGTAVDFFAFPRTSPFAA